MMASVSYMFVGDRLAVRYDHWDRIEVADKAGRFMGVRDPFLPTLTELEHVLRSLPDPITSIHAIFRLVRASILVCAIHGQPDLPIDEPDGPTCFTFRRMTLRSMREGCPKVMWVYDPAFD